MMRELNSKDCIQRFRCSDVLHTSKNLFSKQIVADG